MNQQENVCGMVIHNGILKTADELTPFPLNTAVIYEVIRLISGVPLFIEAHLDRMNHSLQLAGVTEKIELPPVREAVKRLTSLCSVSNQNIRLNAWLEEGRIHWTGYFVESHYPDYANYQKGVPTGLLRLERTNPNAKVWPSHLKAVVAQQCADRQLFEMILVDPRELISEGSRSNLFFTQGDTLVTAPDEAVLQGITRLRLMDIIQEKGISLIKREIAVSELETFDGAFITGTSIHLLPVVRMDTWERQSSKQPLIRQLMGLFDEMVQAYRLAHTYERDQ